MANADCGDADGSVIAARLNHLFATVHPCDRGPYTLREATAAINQAAGRRLMSTAYLSQLRLGQRSNPGFLRLEAIATFFGVHVEYFSDRAATEERERARIAAAMRNPEICDIAMRAAGLSQASLQATKALLDFFRHREGLPDLRSAALRAGV